MQRQRLAGRLARAVGAACLAGALSLGLWGCDRGDHRNAAEQDGHESGKQADVKAQTGSKQQQGDPYLWLEEIQGEKALAWVRKQNERTLKILGGDPRYQPAYDRILAIYQSPDRIAYGQLRAGNVDNFWQDREHVRGLWRRTTLASYKTDSPQWEILLDIDKLAAEEGENWVWKGASCLPPAYTRCMVSLSRGGGDAVVVREFDTSTGRFITDGFRLPEGKQWLAWLDADHLLVATPHGGGMKNTSGYPRTIRIWTRGEPLEKARTIFTGAETDAFVFPVVEHAADGSREAFVVQAPDFFHQTVYHVGDDGTLHRLPLPDDVDFKGVFDGHVIVQLRSAWAPGKTTGRLAEGSVVSIPLKALIAGDVSGATTVMAPSRRVTVRDATIGRNGVYIAILDNVKGRLVEAVRAPGGWRLRPVSLPGDGTVSVVSADPFTDAVLVNYESFLKPDTLYVIEGNGEPEAIKALPPRFDASQYAVDQFFAESEDGTKVPYFLIHRKDMPHDATTPTILYGYGGFEIALTPQYLSPMAIEWLKAGGAYAIANIRGGGEFGPRWHRAALKENRPKAYADFAAVAYDLV
ncbi:MAG: S9 family peptidase, partial [Alphaproteobacteria bacterium]